MTLGTLCVEVEASRVVAVRTLQAQFGDGYKARRPDGINTLMETWSIRTPMQPVAEVQALEAEIIALGANSFGWTPPFETVEKQWVLEPKGMGEKAGGNRQRHLPLDQAGQEL